MNKKSFFSSILLLFFALQLNAQRLPVQNYSTKDGLISNFITELYQDSRGYLWIGTDEGISLFDGNKFKNIHFDETKVWGYVNDIIESKLHPGQMWIGTNGGGLIRYRNGEMTSYSMDSIPTADNINSIIETNDGSLWCATDNGLYFFSNEISNHVPSKEPTKYLKITQSLDGTIWGFDEHNLYLFSPKEQALTVPDIKDLPTDSIIYISVLSDSSVAIHVKGPKKASVNIIKNSSIIKKFDLFFPTAVFTVLDAQKRYWIGTGEGLQLINDAPNNPFFWIYTTTNGLPANELTIGYQDREQNIWFGSFGRGITKLEMQQSVQFTFPGMSGKGAADRFSHIWIPSSHGLYEVWQDSIYQWKRHFHLLNTGNEVVVPVSIVVDSSNNLWVSHTDGSLHYFSVSRRSLNNSTLQYKQSLSGKNGFPRALGISLLIDSKNILWYGLHFGGIVGVDFSSKPKIIAEFNYQKNTTLRDARVLYEDKQGNIYVMGFEPVNRIVRRTNDGIVLDSTSAILSMLPTVPFRSVLETHDGTLLFGSRYNGLFYLRNGTLKQLTTKNGLISNQIWSLYEMQNNGILIGTQSGLMFMHDYNAERFTSLQQYTQSPVLTISSMPEISFALTRFELTLFNIPSDTTPNTFPQVLFTSLFVNGKERRLDKEIELTSAENTFTIDYTAISFRNTGALRFQYKLEPLEEDWRDATTNRSVTYANLSPGNYVFTVRSMNQEGKASDISSILPISIASPIWLRWWFIVLVFITIFGIVTMAERVRVRRLLEIEKIRSRIAADLHDDIGSGLTRIALLSDMIHRQAISEKKITDQQFSVPSLTEKVGTISRELVDAMSDVVWSIDPKNSSMEKLLQRVQTFAVEVCEAKEIALIFSIDDVEKIKVGSDSIRAVLLVAKEALTNVARHSNAKNVGVTIRSAHHQLVIEISDDGKGFTVDELSRMNGLTNMRVRIEKNGGIFTLNSAKGRGTIVMATIPLHK